MSSTSTKDNGLIRFPNNHLLDPKSLYLNNDTADVQFTFEVDDEEILVPAHKIILALRSPVFYSMFYGDLKETGNVKVSDASVKGFKEFLALFYLDEVKITGENVFELTNLANKYDMSHGLEMCEQFLLKNTDTDELCTQLGFAIKYNLNKLQEYCKEIVQVKAVEVLRSDDFINTPMDALKVILQLEDFNCFETDVFNACMRWAENACKQKGIVTTDEQNLRHALGECFYLIPITAMNIEDFSRVIASNKSLFAIEEVSDIMTYIATAASTEYTNKFACSVNNAVEFNWNQELLTCKYEIDAVGNLICADEYATFSSSHKLLFGGFRLFGFRNVGSDVPLSGTIFINRRGDTLFPNRLHEKIEFISNVDNAKILFKLNKALIIKPHMKYTIHVRFSENALNDIGCLKYWGCSAATKYEQTIPFIQLGEEEDIYIKFHKDPEVSVYQMYSLISDLYFNRL